eukprot:tig00000828_g4631.t1
MAADILLYQTDLVPVGEDQRQHLELARDIADRTNRLYGKVRPVPPTSLPAPPSLPPPRTTPALRKRIFRIPEGLINKTGGARVMSLADGTSKMSKSDANEGSRINLLDTPEQIKSKIKKCKTDAERGLRFDDPNRPECTNLLTIYSLMSGKSREEVAEECAAMSWGDFKPVLTEATVEHLRPIQARYNEVMKEEGYLREVLLAGRDRAGAVADATLARAYDALGFLRVEDL